MFAGIDIGSRSIELVVVENSRVVHAARAATTFDPVSQCHKLFDAAPACPVVATGYGRELAAANGFGREITSITEIKAHALGAAHRFPQAGGVLDIGGQDTKAIALLPGGKVAKFEMNDRCAAGTGKFLEFLANVFQIPVEEFGAYALSGTPGIEVSSMCTVFAETEATSLMAKGRDPKDIALGLHASVVRRTANMLRRVGVADGITPVVFSGGVAHNPCIVHLLGQALGQPLLVAHDPDMTGALGAALWGERRG
ncbi:acyl-CoA dehydratase activase [Desulfolutivibrio sulfoxidireducens]|uniref:acyl-CoA dehydratase activase n=1 Tax=Desulfolutivibrio sulfoxidireducens TaxID=2773299 RepID=UPI00159E2BE0|nr:acyl-CoA dehydratase activase [Desulfolutivibrio sulfoxidireducens]QLA18685.1 3-hydroxyacyl-ACP dehydratase [Desulfolutivibrio sulfoxidireducens]